jgi:transcriptional regulator with XRE-family HTH domain
VQSSRALSFIDLELPLKLQDPAYRERFFLAEASAEIARQLIALRKRRGLSQVELAAAANTQQPAVSRAEQADYHNWSFNALRKLTNAMGGRLRVVIEPWEDVIGEYYPEGYSSEAEALRRKEEEELAQPHEASKSRAQMYAATAGDWQRGIQSAVNTWANLNRESGLSARLSRSSAQFAVNDHAQRLGQWN